MKKTNERNELYPETYTFISSGSKIKGDLEFSSRVSISGEVKGNISVLNNSHLIIESTATIVGDITGSRVDIYGSCFGQIVSNDIVTFHSSSHFKGTLLSKAMNIQSGAIVNLKVNSSNKQNQMN